MSGKEQFDRSKCFTFFESYYTTGQMIEEMKGKEVAYTMEVDKRIMKAFMENDSFNSRKNPWMYNLAKVIANNNCCKEAAYMPKGSRSRVVMFIGLQRCTKGT